MKRLTHSPAGYIRTLQISKQEFFIFVEGGLDRAFYDRLLQSSFIDKNISYEIRAAKELPGATGGKARLLDFFRELRRTKKLSSFSLGKNFSSAFFLDKDIDDISRKKIRSPHIIYTKTYDLEGHLISCGDLGLALADSCGITKGQANLIVGEKDVFLRRLIENWLDWTTLCVISQINNVNVGCTFDRPSAINSNGAGEVELEKLDSFKKQLSEKIGVDENTFSILYLKYREKIRLEISKGNSLRFFKGKWFKHILQVYVNQMLNIPDANANSLGEKLMVALLGQVAARTPCECCSPFSVPLTSLSERFH